MKTLALIILLALGLLNTPALASQLTLQVANVQWVGGTQSDYDAFDSGEYPQVVSFKVLLTGDPVEFFVTFSTSADPLQRKATLGAGYLDYQIYDSAAQRTVLKDLPSATSAELIQGTFATNESEKQLTFTIIVPPGQIKSSGLYADSIELTVYEGTLAQYVERDSKIVDFQVRAAQITELSFANAGSAFNPNARTSALDFGTLAPEQKRDMNVRIRSNAGYRVTMESEHGGIMKHLDAAVPTTIPYQVHLGGVPVALTAGLQTPLIQTGRRTTSEGDAHNLEVTIGEISGARAGTYRDTITLTVISDE